MREKEREAFTDEASRWNKGEHVYVSLTRKKAVEVENFAAASIAVRKFIEQNDFGSSDFIGGEVYDSSTDKLIAKISYNGRIWGADGHQILS